MSRIPGNYPPSVPTPGSYVSGFPIYPHPSSYPAVYPPTIGGEVPMVRCLYSSFRNYTSVARRVLQPPIRPLIVSPGPSVFSAPSANSFMQRSMWGSTPQPLPYSMGRQMLSSRFRAAPGRSTSAAHPYRVNSLFLKQAPTTEQEGGLVDSEQNKKPFNVPNPEDALFYLDQIRSALGDGYYRFLDIMNDYRSHRINVLDTVNKISTLFKDRRELIEKFNIYLSPGYKIVVDDRKVFSLEQPGKPRTVVLLDPPHQTNESLNSQPEGSVQEARLDLNELNHPIACGQIL